MYMYWDGFLVVHQTPNAKNMYSQPTRHSWWPLLPFLLSLCTAQIAVPGYSQVSAGRKDLFFCFASPVSVVSWGEGRGGVTSVRGLALNPPNGLSLALHGGSSTVDVHSVHSLPPPPRRHSFFWHWTSIVIELILQSKQAGLWHTVCRAQRNTREK